MYPEELIKETEYAMCRIAIAPIRGDATDRAEIVSQLLFGDRLSIIAKQEKWWLIESAHDNYQGWVDFKQLALISHDDFVSEDAVGALAPCSFTNTLTAEDGSTYHLSPGSSLPFYQNGTCRVGTEQFVVNFSPFMVGSKSIKDIEEFAHFFLNTPYLWGGRNVFGIDCSGFVQLMFKFMGIALRRDANQQAEHGEIVSFLSEATLGDVAFFDNAEQKITHVGLMLNNHTIIHSAGKVRIDDIDDQGIFNKELGKYTHALRIIKRFR